MFIHGADSSQEWWSCCRSGKCRRDTLGLKNPSSSIMELSPKDFAVCSFYPASREENILEMSFYWDVEKRFLLKQPRIHQSFYSI